MTIVGLQGSNAYTSGPMVDCLSFLKSFYISQLPHLSHTIYTQCSKCLIGELKFDVWVQASVKSAERTNETETVEGNQSRKKGDFWGIKWHVPPSISELLLGICPPW